MHYEDQSRRFNLLSGLVVGVVVGTTLTLASGSLSRIELPRRRRSRRERVVRGWRTVRHEAGGALARAVTDALSEALSRARR